MSAITTKPYETSVKNTPAAATQATIASEAPNPGNGQILVTAICGSVAANAAAQTPIELVLRDGATGVGAIVFSKKLAAPVNGMGSLDLSGLSIPMTPGNVATLEFVAAGVAGSEESVSLVYTTSARLA